MCIQEYFNIVDTEDRPVVSNRKVCWSPVKTLSRQVETSRWLLEVKVPDADGWTEEQS